MDSEFENLDSADLDLEAIVQEFSSKPQPVDMGPEPDLIAVNPLRSQSEPTEPNTERPTGRFTRPKAVKQPKSDSPEEPNPPVRRQRRKKTQGEVFREAYLPILWILVGIVGLICIIVGIVKLASTSKPTTEPDTSTVSQPVETGSVATNASAEEILTQAQALASHYDYAAALALMNSYTGDTSDVAGWTEAISTFTSAQEALVPWTDVTNVPHISFQPLIADTSLAWDGDASASDYAAYNLTTTEFSAILQQLYANGYVLVSIHDVAVRTDNTLTAGEILLPEGKKPLIISEVPVNYYSDTHDDGFATRLIVGTDGKPTCEMTNASGVTVTGDYDIVPILDAFIEAHPDFSYHGAKALLAVTGYEGVLGYNTSAAYAEENPEGYAANVENAKKVAQCLLDNGYEFACFSYANVPYGSSDTSEVTADSDAWVAEVTPILGDCDVLIYAKGSDLTTKDKDYSGSKFRTLYSAGFRYFITMDSETKAWGSLNEKYYRQSRRTIHGNRITQNADQLTDLFDASSIVSSERP